MAVYRASLALALFLALGLLLAGCAEVKSPADPAVANPVKLQGVWSGLSVNDCSPVQVDPSRCRAVERITLTLLHYDRGSWGFYGCAPVSARCYQMADRGEIKYLKLTGRMLWFRVMRDDHSSCLLDAIPTADRMRGQFWCFQGDALIERGIWQVHRDY